MQCPLQFAYDQDTVSSQMFRRGNTFTALGNAAHALEEAVHKGEFDRIEQPDLSSSIDRYWMQLVEKELEKLREKWPEYEIPRANDLPRYSVVFCNSTERANSLVTARRNRQPGASKIEVEQSLVDSENSIEGRPDRYRIDGNEFTVIDIKSGVITDSIQPMHRHQLLTYCHLVRLKTGLTPKSIAVQDIEGNLVVEEITTTDVENHLKKVIEVKNGFLVTLSKNGSMLNEAQPGKETCAHCNYRAICPAYWNQPLEQRQPSDIRGPVVAATDSSFTVRRDACLADEPEFMTVIGCKTPIRIGSSVTVAGGHIFGNSIRAGVGTTIFEVEGAQPA